MTVYVDNMRRPARVGRISARWSHLTADTHAELHAFAARIGLRRSWFQERCKFGRCEPCPHWHYDVTDSKRNAAIRAGAQAIDIRELGALIRARRHGELPS
jgi:hypothetical protein